MRILLTHILALAAALFNGKLVAGAISGIVLTPMAQPFEHRPWIGRYLVPALQGITMGFVAAATASWVLGAFGLGLGWPLLGVITAFFVALSVHLWRRDVERRHFHLAAGTGEILGLAAAAYFYLPPLAF